MENRELKKNMGLSMAMAMVVGSVIGSGVFFKPQALYTTTGGAPGLAMLAWAITGIVCMLGGMTFAEIAILIPKTGGMVAYLEEVFGPRVGFVCGWMQSVLFYPAMISALAVAFAQSLAVFIGERFIVPAAVLCIAVSICIHCISSEASSKLQIVSTICKLLPLGILIVFGFVLGNGENPILTPMLGEGLSAGNVLGQLMMSILFAFEGWTNVGTIAGEMKDPGKDLPKAIIGGVGIIMAVYIVINTAYLWVLPADQLMNEAAPAAAVAMALFGPVGGKIVSLGIMISCFGTCNSFLLGGSCVVYQLGREGSLPFSNVFGKLNDRLVPANAIILSGCLGALFALSGRFNMLTDLAVFSAWTFYTLTFYAVIRYRKMRPDLERSYKVPLYPVVPVIAIISGLYVLLNQLFLSGRSATSLSIGSIVVTAVGIPVYAYMHRKA